MSKVRYLGSPYEDSPYRDMWNPGDQAHFEYHCHRGHDSEDYPLWYRSHQPVTIMNRHETDLDPYLRGEKAWRDDEFGGPFPHTPEMRMDYGMPFAYQVKFPDHHQGTVMEDELYTHPRYFDPQGGPPSYEEQMQNHPEHAQRLGSHKRAFSPSFYHVAPAAKRSACCHPQRTCGRSRTWLEDTAQMFEHRLGRRSFKQSAKVPVNYHGQIDPLNEMGNLKGYAGRWPTLYDGKAVHIGPEGSVHLDLRDELGVDQGWNSIRLPPETGMTEGWIGPNGDKDSGDYEDEYGGDRYTPGTKVGWYDEGHVPHPDVEMSAYNYWKTFLKPDISPDTPGGYGHGPKLTNWQFKQSIQTPMSYDPTRCASCGGLMSEPKMVGNQWMNRCTRCGRTRVVPTTSPALQQYQQNFPAYPEALRAVGPERPWFTSKQAQGPVWSPNTLELDPGPMGDTLRDAIKGSRWQFLYRTSEPDWGGDYRHTYDMVPVGAPASHFYQGNYGERSNKTYAYDPEVAEPVDGEFRTDFNWKGHPVWQREAYREPEAEGWGLREPFKEQNPPDPNMLYRGLSHEEWEDAKQRGYFRSTGEYNIGGEPTGSTMFSSDPRQAESYAVGFAPWHRKPGFTTPSYVIATPRSAEAYAHPSLGTEEGGNTEIIVPHPVPFDQVSQAWQFKPYAMEHGEVTLGKDAGRYYRAMGQKSGSGQHMWRPMDPAEWQSRQSNWGAGKISQVTKGLSQKISQPCFPQGVLTP